MSTDVTTTRTSRRGLLGAGLAALAAAAAASVARFTPAAAADGDTVTVGSSNQGSNVTSFNVTGSGGLAATSDAHIGVAGRSTSGQGVNGQSGSSAGVAGVSDSSNGVHGTSTSGRGVYGQSTSGPGVEGSGAIGVKAESSSGYAIETTAGRVKLAGISGIATIPTGETQVTIKPNVPISSSTLVLVSPQENLNGKELWYTKPSSGDSFNIHLSGSRSNNTKVSWLILEHS